MRLIIKINRSTRALFAPPRREEFSSTLQKQSAWHAIARARAFARNDSSGNQFCRAGAMPPDPMALIIYTGSGEKALTREAARKVQNKNAFLPAITKTRRLRRHL
jgi:hypothetical protein